MLKLDSFKNTKENQINRCYITKIGILPEIDAFFEGKSEKTEEELLNIIKANITVNLTGEPINQNTTNTSEPEVSEPEVSEPEVSEPEVSEPIVEDENYTNDDEEGLPNTADE